MVVVVVVTLALEVFDKGGGREVVVSVEKWSM